MAYKENDELPDREKAREFYSKYEPKDVLGKGLSSVVRKCIEKSTGKEYAVKIVEYSGPDLKESTVREIEVMRIIGGHPNISKLDKTDLSTLALLNALKNSNNRFVRSSRHS